MNSSIRWVNQVTGLIFDLDGVLIQSRSAHARAFQEVLGECGIGDFEYDDFAGWRTAEVFREVFRDRHMSEVSDTMISEFSRRKSQRARDLIAAEKPIAADCVPVIR